MTWSCNIDGQTIFTELPFLLKTLQWTEKKVVLQLHRYRNLQKFFLEIENNLHLSLLSQQQVMLLLAHQIKY